MIAARVPTLHVDCAWPCLCLVLCLLLVLGGCTTTSGAVLQGDLPPAGKKAPPMYELSLDERRQKFYDDLDLIKRYDQGLRDVLFYASKHPELFPKDDQKTIANPEPVQLSPENKQELQHIWRATLDYMRALDGIKRYWRDYKKLPIVQNKTDHARAYLAGYLAWIVQFRHGLEFMETVLPSEVLEVILDDAIPRYSIEKDSFARLKWRILHVENIRRLIRSRQYFSTLQKGWKEDGCNYKISMNCIWALKTLDSYHRLAEKQLDRKGPQQFAFNAADIARDKSFDAWFPVQSDFAEWMGDTKVARLHRHLISKQQIRAVLPRLQPGDIIVARHNWYLSNIGLPGFWPHAELFLGSPDELTAYFDDPKVTDFLQTTHGADSLPELLETKFPKAWALYNSEAEKGHPRRIMEAISEGVSFSSLEKAAAVDYSAAFRPKFSRVDKARTILRAFQFVGRPYDFNFDFLTDESLVCTELVYKAWLPINDKKGPSIDLQLVMGRTTLPANELVKQFDSDLKRDNPQFEFVYFLDGREKKRDAVLRDQKAFRQSWKRPKWDIVQK